MSSIQYMSSIQKKKNTPTTNSSGINHEVALQIKNRLHDELNL